VGGVVTAVLGVFVEHKGVVIVKGGVKAIIPECNLGGIIEI
jgi:hypothetical protein